MLIEFPDLQAAHAWHGVPGHQPLKAPRQRSVRNTAVLFHWGVSDEYANVVDHRDRARHRGRDYVGDFRVRDDGTSTVEWRCEFAVERGQETTIVASIRTFLRSGLDSLQAP